MGIDSTTNRKDDPDRIYHQAVAFVREHQDTSCAGLQRNLRLGYTQAMQLKERMEKDGIYDGIERHVEPGRVVIKVVGVGGAGNSALEPMISGNLPEVEAIAVNTDKHGALATSTADKIIYLGGMRSRGRKNRNRMRALALQRREQLEEALRGANIVFIAAGLGGNTGSGIAPLIAEISKAQGALSIGVVYEPMSIEDDYCRKIARDGLRALKPHTDALFVIPLADFDGPDGERNLYEVLCERDRMLYETVAIFARMFAGSGNFTPSFFDLKTVMRKPGRAMLGVGSASGTDRARRATELACAALSEKNIDQPAVRGLLIVVELSRNSRASEWTQITPVARSFVPDASIVMSTVFDDAMCDEIRVNLVVTGM